MLLIRQYNKKTDFETWNSFNEYSKNGSFLFHRNFMDYHADRFEDNSLLFYEDDELIALLPASIHKNELCSHGGLTYGGFITNDRMKQPKMLKCFDALKLYMQERSILKLLYKATPYIYHKYPADECLYALFISNAKLVKTEPSSTIFLPDAYKMPKGRKALISRAKRERVVVFESDDFDSFIELENQVLENRHNTKAVHTAKELQVLKSYFKDEIRLYIAKCGEELLAGVLIFEYPALVHTQYMANSDKGCNVGALDLLIYELIQKYAVSKTYLDFGISTECGGMILNEGLCAQKEGFGGRTVCYQTWEVVL